jgi:hypothetical protein
MYVEAYYASYLTACALVIGILGWILHRSGSVFLSDAFAGNRALVRAVALLLDTGFYLVSVGYVCVTYSTYWDIHGYDDVAKQVIGKLGGMLLLLGVAHLVNLLVLAIFRRRGSGANGTAATGTPGSNAAGA